MQLMVSPEFEFELYPSIINIQCYLPNEMKLISAGVLDIGSDVKLLNQQELPRMLHGKSEIVIFYRADHPTYTTLVLTLHSTTGISNKIFNLTLESSNVLGEIPPFFSKYLLNKPLYSVIGDSIQLGTFYYSNNQLYRPIGDKTEIYYFDPLKLPTAVFPLAAIEIGRVLEQLDIVEEDKSLYSKLKQELKVLIKNNNLEKYESIIMEGIQ